MLNAALITDFANVWTLLLATRLVGPDTEIPAITSPNAFFIGAAIHRIPKLRS